MHGHAAGLTGELIAARWPRRRVPWCSPRGEIDVGSRVQDVLGLASEQVPLSS